MSIREDMAQNIHEASNSTAIGIAILVVVLVLSPLIIFLVRNAASTIQVCCFRHFLIFLYSFSYLTNESNFQEIENK